MKSPKSRRLFTLILSLLASAVLAACLVFGGLAIISTGEDANNACTASNQVADAVIGVLQDAQDTTRKSPPQTTKEEQRRDALRFYDNAIKRLQDSKC